LDAKLWNGWNVSGLTKTLKTLCIVKTLEPTKPVLKPWKTA
jgi:hypothetical protein